MKDVIGNHLMITVILVMVKRKWVFKWRAILSRDVGIGLLHFLEDKEETALLIF